MFLIFNLLQPNILLLDDIGLLCAIAINYSDTLGLAPVAVEY